MNTIEGWPVARAIFVLAAVAALLGAPVSGDAAAFYTPAAPDPSIPQPEAFLGYPLGTRFTPHHRLVAYLEAVAEASPRVEIRRYGTTANGRPLLLLAVSSPENLGRQHEIRENYARIADPRRTNLGEARGRSRELPVAVWFSYGIHGNESSPSEAAIALVYHLAAERDAAVDALLDRTILLVDPCLNPDGHERYVSWFHGTLGSKPDPNPAAREHHEPWPGGRYNHYLFDLNRDWAWLSQSESRDRAKVYRMWRPQVHVDFHEMFAEDTYFFFPPERPIHPLYPAQVQKWGEIFGRANAAAFDARGWRYYTAEFFDLYYPGYGDTWPTFHGAVGMTYEQAGHSRGGVELALDDGGTLTLYERAEHHYTASLATLRTAADHREARLLDFHRFFEADPDLAPDAYLIPPGGDPPRAARLVSLLMEHGAEVYRTREAVRPRNLTDYSGRPHSEELPAGTYVVPLDQPLHRFLRAVLDPDTALPDTLFYDISAWSLPLAFGVDAYASRGRVGGRQEQLTVPPAIAGTRVNPGATYAHLIPWNRNGAPKAAALLQRRGVRLHFTSREFGAAGRTFPPGSLIAFVNENLEGLDGFLDEAADSCGVEIVGVNTGLTDSGPDLGSSRVRRLQAPRVALLAGDPVEPTSLGACWYLLDREYGFTHSLIDLERLNERDLGRFDVLVFPDDGDEGAGYATAVDSAAVAAVAAWIRRGGVFIGLGGGGFFATADISGLSSATMAPEEDADELSEEEAEARDTERRLEFHRDREFRRRTNQVPGTIFRIRVDPLHPLGFGYTETASVLKLGYAALDLGPEGTNVAVFADRPRVSGYAPDDAVRRLIDRPFLIAEPSGRGHVVLYVEDPNFRLFWYGLTRLFLNGLLFLPSMD